MAYIKSRIERFLGTEITLRFKNGSVKKMGDGLLISDGEKVHIWTGKVTGDGKNFLIPTTSVREVDVRILKSAAYRNVKNGNFEVFDF
ncbi:MAG: hypothetical protein M1155_01970 [Patescibacteria group bacterium]|nr:hypothetical protein [Patescibacteria group bacterium]